MGTKRKRQRHGPIMKVHSDWPSCGHCDRQLNVQQDELFVDPLEDDIFVLGWRCECGSVSYTAMFEDNEAIPINLA
jgi:hypothetical protein